MIIKYQNTCSVVKGSLEWDIGTYHVVRCFAYTRKESVTNILVSGVGGTVTSIKV